MFVTSYSVTYCIYVLEKPGICFHYHCAVYDECKYSDTFWLADRTPLYSTLSHYHYCANLSEGIELINACQIYFVECVSKIKHILSVIHYTITETKMSSFWLNFHHWLHWKLSFWQLPVQPVIKISSKWRHFCFSDMRDCMFSVYLVLLWWLREYMYFVL